MVSPRRAIGVSTHALNRVRERFPALRGKPVNYLHRVLLAIAHKGQIIGESAVAGEEYRLGTVPPGRELVLHVKPDRDNPRRMVITTVLTLEEAHNAGGFREPDDQQSKPVPESQSGTAG